MAARGISRLGCHMLALSHRGGASATVGMLQTARPTRVIVASQAFSRFMSTSPPDAAAAEALESFRQQHRFRRWLDGRVQLKGSDGSWHDLKLDANVEGALLLRDSEGRVYYLASGSLKQVDLSNDEFVGNLFASGQWEEAKQPLIGSDSSNKPAHICMTEDQFRRVLSILKEVPPPNGEPDESHAGVAPPV